MKTYIAAFLILATSGLVWAVDAPNTPPHKGSPPGALTGGERPGPGHERMPQGRGEMRERLAERHDEYIKWLEKNYPQEATELAAAKAKSPEVYFKRLQESFEKYGRLAHADKTNPELAKALREDMALKSQIEKTLTQLHSATDENQKKQLTAELQKLVSRRFDLIVLQKQIRYQELNKRIEDLKKEVQKQQTDLDSLKSKKDEEVKKRIDELMSNTAKINWD